jgi:hypothetical protein
MGKIGKKHSPGMLRPIMGKVQTPGLVENWRKKEPTDCFVGFFRLKYDQIFYL